MSKIEIKKALFDFGLKEKEIKIYLAILSLGEATASELAKTTKIKRTTIYLVVEKLTDKEIIGEYKAKYGTHYVASEPKSLITRLNDIKINIRRILPELEVIKKRKIYEPNIKLYRGRKGYLTILNDSLKGYSYEVLYLGSAKELNKIITEKYVDKRYIPKRLKRKIRFKQIVFPDKFSKNQKKRDIKELRETKFLPLDYEFKANMIIYQDKVAYFSSRRELISVLVESKDIAQMEKAKFELLWEKL